MKQLFLISIVIGSSPVWATTNLCRSFYGAQKVEITMPQAKKISRWSKTADRVFNRVVDPDLVERIRATQKAALDLVLTGQLDKQVVELMESLALEIEKETVFKQNGATYRRLLYKSDFDSYFDRYMSLLKYLPASTVAKTLEPYLRYEKDVQLKTNITVKRLDDLRMRASELLSEISYKGSSFKIDTEKLVADLGIVRRAIQNRFSTKDLSDSILDFDKLETELSRIDALWKEVLHHGVNQFEITEQSTHTQVLDVYNGLVTELNRIAGSERVPKAGSLDFLVKEYSFMNDGYVNLPAYRNSSFILTELSLEVKRLKNLMATASENNKSEIQAAVEHGLKAIRESLRSYKSSRGYFYSLRTIRSLKPNLNIQEQKNADALIKSASADKTTGILLQMAGLDFESIVTDVQTHLYNTRGQDFQYSAQERVEHNLKRSHGRFAGNIYLKDMASGERSSNAELAQQLEANAQTTRLYLLAFQNLPVYKEIAAEARTQIERLIQGEDSVETFKSSALFTRLKELQSDWPAARGGLSLILSSQADTEALRYFGN